MSEYGLQDDDKKIILEILKTYPQIEEVVLFGSRALNTFKSTSDIDLAIKGKDTNSILAALMADFEESDLIYEVDLVDYASISTEKLLEHIDRYGTVFYRKGWVETTLDSIAGVIDSLHKTPIYSNDGYPMVRVTDIKRGYLNTTDCFRVNNEVFKDFSKKHLPEKYDIVFSRVGSEGIAAFVSEPQTFCLGQNTVFITPKIKSSFLYYWLGSSNAKGKLMLARRGQLRGQ